MIYFFYGNQSWKIEKNPELENKNLVDSGVVLGRAASGAYYRYEKAAKNKIIKLRFLFLCVEDAEKLRDAFSVLGGNEFEFSDWTGKIYNVIFGNTTLEVIEVRPGRYNAEIELIEV